MFKALNGVHPKIHYLAEPLDIFAANEITITSRKAETYEAATKTFMLGRGALAHAFVSGNRLFVESIDDGIVNKTGIATHFALINNKKKTLNLSSSFECVYAVTRHNNYKINQFEIKAERPLMEAFNENIIYYWYNGIINCMRKWRWQRFKR